MNILNRIVLVVLMLGLIFSLTLLLIFPDQILSAVGQFLLDWGQYFARVDQQQPMLRLGIGIGLVLIIDLLILLFIILEVKPSRKKFVKLEKASGGTATISVDSINRQLLYKLDPLPGVVKVNPVVRPKGNAVQAQIDVEVAGDSAVPQMADHLLSIAKQTINDDLGLVIAGEPQVRIKVVEGMKQRPASPSAPAPAVSEGSPPPLPILETDTVEDSENAAQPPERPTETEKEKDDWA